MRKFAFIREEEGGGAGGEPPAGGGAASVLGGGDPPPAAPAAPATPTPADSSTPAADYSFYTKDEAGVNSIKPELAAVYAGDDNSGIRNLMLKFKDSDNPMGELSKSITNLNYLAKSGNKDHLLHLPEDAPQSLKDEVADMRRQISGAPEDAAGYGLERPTDLPENVYWPEGIEQKHMELAHKHGVSKEFLQEQMQMHGEMLGGAGEYEETVYNQRRKNTGMIHWRRSKWLTADL